MSFSKGDKVTLNDGATAEVVKNTGNNDYVLRLNDGSIVGVNARNMKLLSPNTKIANEEELSEEKKEELKNRSSGTDGSETSGEDSTNDGDEDPNDED